MRIYMIPFLLFIGLACGVSPIGSRIPLVNATASVGQGGFQQWVCKQGHEAYFYESSDVAVCIPEETLKLVLCAERLGLGFQASQETTRTEASIMGELPGASVTAAGAREESRSHGTSYAQGGSLESARADALRTCVALLEPTTQIFRFEEIIDLPNSAPLLPLADNWPRVPHLEMEVPYDGIYSLEGSVEVNVDSASSKTIYVSYGIGIGLELADRRVLKRTSQRSTFSQKTSASASVERIVSLRAGDKVRVTVAIDPGTEERPQKLRINANGTQLKVTLIQDGVGHGPHKAGSG
jgi:hypothetical protein